MGEGGKLSFPFYFLAATLINLAERKQVIENENGMSINDPSEFLQNQSQPAEQRQVVRTKTLGSVADQPRKPDYKKIAEKISREQELSQQNEQLAEKAEEIQGKIIDKASEMRYLKYEIIDEADIVQISVVNSADGTVVRKVPSDKVVNFVKEVREKEAKKERNLDIKA